MDTFIGLIAAIFILGLLISVHEFGHFIVAKRNGVHVIEFSIGFGPTIISKTVNGTKYSLKWILFGGACQMLGADLGLVDMEDEEYAKMLKEQEGRSFTEKSVWARMAILFAGPFFNFLLAFVLAIVLFAFAGVDTPRVGKAIDDYPAQAAGIETGDVIYSVNGHRIMTQRDLQLYMQLDYKEGPLTVVFERDGEKHTVELTPKLQTQEMADEEAKNTLQNSKKSDEEKVATPRPLIGIQYMGREDVGALRILRFSGHEVVYWMRVTVKSLGMLFTGKASVNDLSGPVGVVGIMGETVTETKSEGVGIVLLNFLNLAILFSVNLGIMNLLPIPALDGGRLLFCLIELIRRKPVPREKEGYVTLAGALLLFALVIFVFFNDIRKFFF
ncbi:MAG: site-2 protease family protein [Lachnospiraceae bacterium]|nr:site-2 protease family protein [Lachnospiraceae bacterium]